MAMDSDVVLAGRLTSDRHRRHRRHRRHPRHPRHPLKMAETVRINSRQSVAAGFRRAGRLSDFASRQRSASRPSGAPSYLQCTVKAQAYMIDITALST